MGIFMNTRHSASESGHVTAELEALVNEATLCAGNYVFEAGNKFAITITPVTGKVNVSNGVFSWCGRLGGVDEFETVQYTPPGSETLYKKIVIGARYSKTPGSLVENIFLEAIESEVQSSESAAAGVTLTLDSDEIKPDTVSAFLPLWEFTANSKTHSTPVKKFNTVNNLKILLNRAGELSNQIADEATARKNADKSLRLSISAEATERQNADQNLQANISDEATARRNADTGLDNRLKLVEPNFEFITDSMVNTAQKFPANRYRLFVFLVQVSSTYTSPYVLTFPAMPGQYQLPIHYISKGAVGDKVETTYVYAGVSEDSIVLSKFGYTGYFTFKGLYGIT
jgi:hypothetical protein